MHRQPQPDAHERWINHQRSVNRSATTTYTCPLCSHLVYENKRESALWEHCLASHSDQLAPENDLEEYKKTFLERCARKPAKYDARRLNTGQTDISGTALQTKRPLHESQPARFFPAIETLSINTPDRKPDLSLFDEQPDERAKKRAATGDGISIYHAGVFPQQNGGSASPPRRSKSRPASAPYGKQTADNRDTEKRSAGVSKQIWIDGDAALTRSSIQDSSNIASIAIGKQRSLQLRKQRMPQSSSPQTGAQAFSTSLKEAPEIVRASSKHSSKDESPDLIHQPEMSPISQEQLVAEIKGIYAGLVMVEAKCIEVDGKQAQLAKADQAAQPKLNNEQWQALIALHRTLLHEHHDFFLASQHPCASPTVRKLASKYAMPARMWRHGIHSFLELLRHRLPASLDHMLAFIYIAYSMMALLYETVPAFEDTWIECLGDLGRYRMAIEDDNIRDREVWTSVAKHWYSKASDNTPTTGRLYHHLAILARPKALEQLFYYSKSLCVAIPFTSARESILTLFDPVLKADDKQGQHRLPPLENSFIKAHGILFTNGNIDTYDTTTKEFLGLLDNHVERVTRNFMEQGYYIAIANSVAMLEYGSKTNFIIKAITSSKESDEDANMESASSEHSKDRAFFENAQRLSNATLEVVLKRTGDPNVLPYIHVTLVFLLTITRHPNAMSQVETEFPWENLSVMLNTLLASYETGTRARIEGEGFPLPEKEHTRPVPEDFAMRGLLWALDYFPEGWLTDDKIDEEEKYHERPSMTSQRKERILWLACKIAALESPLNYDQERFFVDGGTKSRSSRSSSIQSSIPSEIWSQSNSDDGEITSG